jgi:hypothetical protein
MRYVAIPEPVVWEGFRNTRIVEPSRFSTVNDVAGVLKELRIFGKFVH